MSRDPWDGDLTSPQTLNPYAYAHNQPTRYTDPSGKWVDEYGKWHPCNLLTETASCIGQLPGWFTSNDIPKFGRYAKGVGKSVIKNLDPLNLGALFTQLQTDPIGTAVAMSHMPTDMAKGMITALRNCDYEKMGELSADIGLTLYGGAELGVGLVDMVGMRPRGLGRATSVAEEFWNRPGIEKVDPATHRSGYPTYQQPNLETCVPTACDMGFAGKGRSVDLSWLYEKASRENGIYMHDLPNQLSKHGINARYTGRDMTPKQVLPEIQTAINNGDIVVAGVNKSVNQNTTHAVLIESVTNHGYTTRYGLNTWPDYTIVLHDPATQAIYRLDYEGWLNATGGASDIVIIQP